MLNLPHYFLDDVVETCKNVLVLGMGGGFDIYHGIPIVHTLENLGINCHLANVTFTKTNDEYISNFLDEKDYGLHKTNEHLDVLQDGSYFPEGYLAAATNKPVWLFSRSGLNPFIRNLKTLIKQENIDGILLVDGGIDSLMKGDELLCGTIAEDTVTLAAAIELNNQVPSWLVCIGLGCEIEEGLTVQAGLKRIANLSLVHSFLGSCALVLGSDEGQIYRHCVEMSNVRNSKKSHIANRVIQSMDGIYGQEDEIQDTIMRNPQRAFIDPLMSIYWFFDTHQVARQNKLIPLLKDTEIFFNVIQKIKEIK
jgi:hypothetical protein